MRVLLCLVGFFALTAAHSCPPLWTSGVKGCYRYFAKAKTWEAAKDHCAQFSSCVGNSIGSLSSIESQNENDFIKNLRESSILAQPAPSCWIGLNDRVVENTFAWANGRPYVRVPNPASPVPGFTNFERGQPNNQGGAEDCVRMPGQTSIDKWDDYDCLQQLPYICHLYADSTPPQGAPTQPGFRPAFIYGRPQQAQIGHN